MTEDDNSKLVDMDDQEAFEKHFFQLEDADEVDEEAEEVAENEDDSLATDDDKDADEEEIETDSEDEDEDEEDEPEVEAKKPEPKPKSKAQKRIEELVTEARVAQRERDAEKRERELLERRLVDLEARTKVTDDKSDIRKQLPKEAPDPDAENEKGDAVYPLGEFDPTFIRDLTRFTIEQETAKARVEAEAREAAQKQAQAQNELTVQWNEKVTKAEEELPDLREKLVDLSTAFTSVEPAYGEYLATTLMSCDNGPEVMYYLSQNIGEAQKIVASGPFAATLAIAKLDAKLAKAPVVEDEEKRNKKRVSDAPPIPVNRTRGKGGQFTTSPDTDDLDAFEKVFFKK